MEIQELKFSYRDLLHTLEPRDIHKLVEYKMQEAGFLKSIDLAVKEGVTRQAISLRIKEHPENYTTVEYGGYLYAKKKC